MNNNIGRRPTLSRRALCYLRKWPPVYTGTAEATPVPSDLDSGRRSLDVVVVVLAEALLSSARLPLIAVVVAH